MGAIAREAAVADPAPAIAALERAEAALDLGADRRQRQEPTGLGRVLAAPCQTPQLGRTEIRSQGDGACHGEPPLLISMNHIMPASGNTLRESGAAGFGIIERVRKTRRDAGQPSAPAASTLSCVLFLLPG